VQTNALSDINLEIFEGEFVTIAGPSGCGKSTLLSILGLLDSPTAGRYAINQTVVEKLDHAALARIRNAEIGFVFQDFNLIGDMTVFENVELPLTHRNVPRKERHSRVMECLESVGMTPRAEHYPAQLSGGQQQRVALARALVFEPELVLLDEPLGALDKQLRERMQIEIKALHERLGVTMVYVTHDQAEALTMSDRIAVFSEGRIRQIASPFEVYENPANAFVAGFIGESNKLEGTIAGRNGNHVIVDIGDGRRVTARAVNDAAVGRRAVLSLRPERVSVDPANGENHMRLPLESIVYVGDSSRLILVGPGGSEFSVKVDRAPFDRGLTRGQQLDVGWRAEDCLAFVE
jgi:putative spermidine/putrescine transport system ATP-binding protein